MEKRLPPLPINAPERKDVFMIQFKSDQGDIFVSSAVFSKVTQKSNTITIDGVGYYLANNAKIFLIEGDDVTVVTAKKLATDYKTASLKANVTGVLNADGEYSALYICK